MNNLKGVDPQRLMEQMKKGQTLMTFVTVSGNALLL